MSSDSGVLSGLVLIGIIVPPLIALVGVIGVVPSWLVQRRGKPGLRPSDVRMPSEMAQRRFRFALGMLRAIPYLIPIWVASVLLKILVVE